MICMSLITAKSRAPGLEIHSVSVTAWANNRSSYMRPLLKSQENGIKTATNDDARANDRNHCATISPQSMERQRG